MNGWRTPGITTVGNSKSVSSSVISPSNANVLPEILNSSMSSHGFPVLFIPENDMSGNSSESEYQDMSNQDKPLVDLPDDEKQCKSCSESNSIINNISAHPEVSKLPSFPIADGSYYKNVITEVPGIPTYSYIPWWPFPQDKKPASVIPCKECDERNKSSKRSDPKKRIKLKKGKVTKRFPPGIIYSVYTTVLEVDVPVGPIRNPDERINNTTYFDDRFEGNERTNSCLIGVACTEVTGGYEHCYIIINRCDMDFWERYDILWDMSPRYPSTMGFLPLGKNLFKNARGILCDADNNPTADLIGLYRWNCEYCPVCHALIRDPCAEILAIIGEYPLKDFYPTIPENLQDEENNSNSFTKAVIAAAGLAGLFNFPTMAKGKGFEPKK